MKFLIFLFLFVFSACTTPSGPNPQARKNEVAAPNSPAASYQSTVAARGLDYDKPLQAIAFGSCFNQDQPAPLWKDVLKSQSDLFVFLGDNIYASSPDQKPISEQYRKLDQLPDFKKLREEVPFLATWDDHDFGERDGGADWGGKENARRDFLNYWTYARNSLPLEQPGIYHSKIIGPKKKRVQVILLDTRYNRDPLLSADEESKKAAKNYAPNNEGTILGEAQWQWLEGELKRPADIRFIASSIQLIANEPPFEKWDNFPKERQRLFDLIRSTKARNVIILSGDRHMGSIAKIDLKDYGPLYEITASSINRPNNYTDQDAHYLGLPFSGVNYGFAKIDWKTKRVHIDLRTLENKVVNQVQIPLR